MTTRDRVQELVEALPEGEIAETVIAILDEVHQYIPAWSWTSTDAGPAAVEGRRMLPREACLP